MPYFRKLPSGKWQATVRGPGGKRYTRTDSLKRVVADWARDEEAKLARGLWRDPRGGRITVGEWCGPIDGAGQQRTGPTDAATWWASRVIEYETRRGDHSQLRRHILPYWNDWPLNRITPIEVQAWVRRLEKDGVGAHAIRRSYNLFTTMLGDAVKAGLLGENPARDVDLPATPRKLPQWFTRGQVDLIRAQLDVRHRTHSVMTELMVVVGSRWGETAAACGSPRQDEQGNPVDWLRGRLRIIGALDQRGRWKEYPKTSKSRREVPVPRYILDEMSALMVGRERHDYVFVTNRGKRRLSGANWRVVWYDAISKANEAIGKANRNLPVDDRVPPIPKLDPHDCRHTAASWLRQAGVSLGDIQVLLGHENSQTTQIYAHLAPDAFGAIEDAWSRILPHVRRTDPGASAGTAR